jgi:hypothetical protein
VISLETYKESGSGAARQRKPLLTQEERNAEARFDRAIRSARAKLIKAFDDIDVATGQQREKLRQARDRLDEAIAIQDEWRQWRLHR